MNKREKILAVIVNYGLEQISYLETVVRELKTFSKYDVTIIVNSNVELIINEIDKVNIIALEDFQLLPLTCRKIIWTNKDNYDVFLYGENDHLFTETHIDNHLLYAEILPKNRISGLLQYEENETGRYYPGYHFDYEWDFDSVEVYKDKKFAHFSNLHQATFILTKKQLLRIGKKIDFTNLVKDDPSKFILKVKNKLTKHFDFIFERPNKYSVKCKVNTDIYEYGGMKKMICISDFEDNLIHHLPNIYIDGLKGRNKFRSDQIRMNNSLIKLLEETRQ